MFSQIDGHDAELQKITCLKPEDEEGIEPADVKKEKTSRWVSSLQYYAWNVSSIS